MLNIIFRKISRYFDEWVNHSYEAWIKAGRSDHF